MLKEKEKSRYARHLILPEFGEEGQLKLKNAKVLIVGIGGLGCTVAMQLAAAGIGHIGLIDGDVVSLSNLQRQLLYTEKDVNKQKVLVATEKLNALNNEIQVSPYPFHLTADNASEIIIKYDVIVDCTDDISTKILCDNEASKTKKPLVYAALHKFEGQVSTFNYKGGPNYTQAFPNIQNFPPPPPCVEVGVYAILPQIIASLQSNEVLKIVTNLGETLSGKILTYNAFNNQFYTINLNINTL